MNPERWKKVKSLFEQASELPEERREGFLESECGEDQALRLEVEGMLAVDQQSPGFLSTPPEIPVAPEVAEPDRRNPRRVGAFRVLRLIAAGGMGVVYEAEQETPRRRVALKMLRSGLLSDSIQRRFLYESEILGRLRHPGIAQIFDAGVHQDESGMDTPYFAMEFVAGGQDLLGFAEERHLGLRERIDLFREVCAAIHHGHQQGVIHRDIKPANLLVDEGGRAKVIDFGVARVTDVDMASHSLATRTGELIGTLRYMSPEQLGGDPAEVDTRSDVYALGYVLYELLCGDQPFEVDGKSMTEVARIIRDDAPRNPSHFVPGFPFELSWVILRALEKEKERRYASASELATDLQRYLADEPLEAGPPSTVYRLRKFARRNRVVVGALAVVAVALVVGAIVAGTGYVAAADEANKFRSINDVLSGILESVQFDRDGRDIRVAELLDRAAEELGANLEQRPEVAAALHATLAKSYHNLGLYAESEEQAERALHLWESILEDDADARLSLIQDLLSSLHSQGKREEFERWLTEGERATSHLGPDHWFRLNLGQHQSIQLLDEGNFEEAVDLAKRTHERAVRAYGARDVRSLETLKTWVACLSRLEPTEELVALSLELMEMLELEKGAGSLDVLRRKLFIAELFHKREELDRALDLYAEALPNLIELVGPEHSHVLLALNNLANLHTSRQEYAESISILEGVIELREKRDGPEHPETITARANLAAARFNSGERGATGDLRAVLASESRIWGPDHPKVLHVLSNLVVHLTSVGQLDEAEQVATDCVARCRGSLGTDDELTLRAIHSLGYLQAVKGNWRGAYPLMKEAWEGHRRVLGVDHELTLRVAASYTTVLGMLELVEEAIPVATEVLAVLREKKPPGDALLSTMLSNLIALHQKNGDRSTAESLARQLLQQVEEHCPEDDPWRAKAHDRLASCLFDRDNLEEAAREFEIAIEMGEFNLALERVQYAAMRQGYGRVLVKLELFDDGADQLLMGLEIVRGETSAGDSRRLELIQELIDVQARIGNEEEVAYWQSELERERAAK